MEGWAGWQGTHPSAPGSCPLDMASGPSQAALSTPALTPAHLQVHLVLDDLPVRPLQPAARLPCEQQKATVLGTHLGAPRQQAPGHMPAPLDKGHGLSGTAQEHGHEHGHSHPQALALPTRGWCAETLGGHSQVPLPQPTVCTRAPWHSLGQQQHLQQGTAWPWDRRAAWAQLRPQGQGADRTGRANPQGRGSPVPRHCIAATRRTGQGRGTRGWLGTRAGDADRGAQCAGHW